MAISDVSRQMIRVFIVCLVVLIAGSIIYYRSAEFVPFSLGAILGIGHNIAKVLLLEWSIAKVMQKKDEGDFASVTTYAGKHMLLRYLFTLVVLLIAAYVPFIDLWGALAGVVTWGIALFFARKTAARDNPG